MQLDDESRPGEERTLSFPIIPPAIQPLPPPLRELVPTPGKQILSPDGQGNQLVDSKELIGESQNKNIWAQQMLKHLDPQDAGVYNNLGCAYAWLHQWDAAKEAFEQALRADDFPANEPKAREQAKHNLEVLERIRSIA